MSDKRPNTTMREGKDNPVPVKPTKMGPVNSESSVAQPETGSSRKPKTLSPDK